MIELAHYWMGRDQTCPLAMTRQIVVDAALPR